ncbi:MAG: HAMP domain-containing protein, partial [Oscillospiraceae bacterium]|nr:HAMP domain-containing protein [Oscillospiraceae bacterium]
MRSLRAQLTLAILLVVAVTVAAISLLANVFIERRFDEYVAEQQAIRASGIVNDLAMQYSTETLAWNQDFIHAVGMYSLYDGYILRVFDADGAVVWDAMNHDMSLCGQIMSDIAARMDRVGAGGGFVTREYNLMRAGGKIGSVEIEYYGPYFLSESDFRFLGALNTALFGASVFALALSLAIGAVLARRIARPVTNAAALAKRISAGDYDTDFDSAPATRELFDLVAAVNHLSGALREQETLRRRLTRDVAHELRTPVTAVSSHLEAMLEGVWEPTPERLAGCREE